MGLISLTCKEWVGRKENADWLTNLQNLVWDGHAALKGGTAINAERPGRFHVQNLHAVNYHGAPHLALSTVELDSEGLNIGGRNIIMDSSYAIVEEFDKPDDFSEMDPHEFETVDNGTAILQTGRIRHSSASPLSENGIVGESAFQLVDLSSRRTKFEWRSLSHVPESETCLTIPQLDYHHINSVEKDFQGNYIINGYHACEMTKINGTDGSIIWRLGGSKSDFKMFDDYKLMHMHHVRIRKLADVKIPEELCGKVSDETHLALSIFDNAFFSLGKRAPTAGSSSAIVVLLDLNAMTGQVIERYTQPEGMYGALFGSVQFLANGDRFIGWGGQRGFSQYTQDNELVFHAEISNEAMPTWSYRTFKGPWSARPTTQPDLYTYSWNCHWNTTMYASWNGATEVESWRFYGSPSEYGPFEETAFVAKNGFETRVMAPFFADHAYVEALDADGSVRGRSMTVKTKVPEPDWGTLCSELRCYQKFDWTEGDGSDFCSEYSTGVTEGMPGQSVLR